MVLAVGGCQHHPHLLPKTFIKPCQKTPVLKHGDEWRVPFVWERGWKEVLPFYTVTATL
ncbi:hypothetical protein Krac_11847 [Ktedonobacter racemifer DSM 44963]|uniref:Uncharacterized protein n=1 Tax=Ktedonobacter racemifer DSM 44963 TaxID=485913 RepID=D6TDV3_KTERA|nr:hypothetical protein Krac_11847 [Ktedonobacter racemifer DSM 44963]